VRRGTGRGRQGPGLLGAMRLPAGTAAGARRLDEVPPAEQRVDLGQGRWLPRHQPWNAASTRTNGRSIDEPSAQLDELDGLQRAGLITHEEFTRRRARLLGT
jgi:Short C-terminal domain